MLRGIEQFLHTFSANQGAARCRTVRSARALVSLIRDLSVPVAEIRIVRVLPRHSEVQPSDEVARVARALGLPATSVEIRPLHETQCARRGKYYVKVVDPARTKRGGLMGRHGFRHAMYMLAILHDSVHMEPRAPAKRQVQTAAGAPLPGARTGSPDTP